MGIGEYDRSCCAQPVQVQQANNEAIFDAIDTVSNAPFNEHIQSIQNTENDKTTDNGSTIISTSQSFSDVESSSHNLDPPVIVPEDGGVIIRKGFQRVSIIPTSNESIMCGNGLSASNLLENSLKLSDDSVLKNMYVVYEVVIHAGEAFLKVKLLKVKEEDEGNSKKKRVVDYSSGWQHNLLVLE